MRVHAPCAGCGSNATTPHISVRDRLDVAPDERFHVVRCRKCGLLRTDPRPSVSELGTFYPQNYAPFERPIADERSPLRRWMRTRYLNKRLRAIRKYKNAPGRALDVGSSTGLFLNALRGAGWQVQGVELNEGAARVARDRMGLDIFTGTLEEAPLSEESFDLITLWHVLEHMPEPVASLDRLYKLLAPGGLLVLTVPNAHSWDGYLWGEYWAGWDAPRHLYHFTPNSLAELLARAGFTGIHGASFTDRHGVWVLSAANWAKQSPQSRLRSLMLRLISTLPAQLLTYPYFLLAERFDRSSAMTFFGQRP